MARRPTAAAALLAVVVSLLSWAPAVCQQHGGASLPVSKDLSRQQLQEALLHALQIIKDQEHMEQQQQQLKYPMPKPSTMARPQKEKHWVRDPDPRSNRRKPKLKYNPTDIERAPYSVHVFVRHRDFEWMENFMCWALRSGVNFTQLPADPEAHVRLKRRRSETLLPHRYPVEVPGVKQLGRRGNGDGAILAAYAAANFKYLKGELERGRGVILLDLRTLLLSDPAYHVDAAGLCDVMHGPGPDKGSPVAVAPTPGGAAFLDSAIYCLRGVPSMPEDHRPAEWACVLDAIAAARESRRPPPPDVFDSSAEPPVPRLCHARPELLAGFEPFFESNAPQKDGRFPSLVHLGDGRALDEARPMLERWSLWAGSGHHCTRREQRGCPFAGNDGPPQLSLTIRVLTMDRPDQLERLLASLKRVEYLGDNISIEFFVDFPDDLIKNGLYAETLGIINDYEWPHGEVTQRVNRSPRGIVEQWLQPHVAEGPHQLLMILEDDLEVSPVFYRWLKAAVEFYYFNCTNYEPNMFGIALERIHELLAYGHHYGVIDDNPHVIWDMFNRDSTFLTQKDSSWGMAFVSAHWNSFVFWARNAKHRGQLPCVYGLVSNKWFLDEPGTVWTPWLHKYFFNKGFYALYFNYGYFDNATYSTALVANYRAPGLHFKGDYNLPYGLASFVPDSFDLRPTSELPVFDYYMRPVPDKASITDRWRSVHGVDNHCYNVWR